MGVRRNDVKLKRSETRWITVWLRRLLAVATMSLVLLAMAGAASMPVVAAADAAIEVRTINEHETYTEIKQEAETYKFY